MKRLYIVVRNALLFYFLVSIYSGVSIYGGSVAGNVLISLIFGALMMAVPLVLGFFKISINASARFFMAMILSFIFFFLMYMGTFGFGSLGGSVVDLGIGGIGVLRMDPLATLISISLVAAFLSTLLHWMSGEAKKW